MNPDGRLMRTWLQGASWWSKTTQALSTRGKVDKASPRGPIGVEDESCLNNRSVVTWEVTLAPGKSLDLSYDLTFHH
ncbi:MAG: hypothetical protein Q8K32_35675 [Archangium sp.]|nr:hypothetical protein [Archangium sp.]